VVIGGGIAGLATALRIRDRAGDVPGGLEVVVLEARDRPGGNIRTDRVDGFTIERGPNGFLDNAPATLDLVRRLGLEHRLQPADAAASRRFIYRNARLHPVPAGPLAFLRSPLLSLPGRLRVFLEPFARARPDDVDETVFDFAARRIGTEAAEVLVDAMVSGVFAGDSRELSLRSSFPKMHGMETEHGGLVRAMVARMRERRARGTGREAAGGGGSADRNAGAGGPAGPGGTLTSFRAGLDEWLDPLAAELADGLRTGAPVTGVARSGPAGRAWRVDVADDEPIAADAVVLAVPAPAAAPLLTSDTPALDGFGFLVPRGEGPAILGCLWDSSIFPGRAPDGHVLVRAMIGGARDPDAVGQDDYTLLDRVRGDLQATMGVDRTPVMTRIYRWPNGIAQYTVGHGGRLDRIHHRLAELPGLWLAGSSYYGVSMNACIEKSVEQAGEVVGFLGPRDRAQ
jgi:oxygen-dependent protoporphyrinogen oxidase